MQSKNNICPIIITVIVTAIVVGGGFYFWQQSKIVPEEQSTISEEVTDTSTTDTEESKNEPLTYSTDGVDAAVITISEPFNYTSDKLISMASECGVNQPAGYFDNLIGKFNGTTKTIYNFKYNDSSQATDTFTVTLLPNKTGYTSLDQFKKDFDQCYAGGDAYPTELNKDWLLFVNSCGSGANDNSGNVNGCQAVRDVVEPTLKLN